MLTNSKKNKLSRDLKFILCSENTFFSKVLRAFSKMDIYKCPFSLLRLDFCEKYVILEYIFPK